jgi:hypothetical protein
MITERDIPDGMTQVDALVAFPIGVLSGIVATLGMDVVMERVSEGKTAPRVASGVLTETHPDESPERLSGFVHYFAGAGSGALYAYILLAVSYAEVGTTARLAIGAFVLYVGMVGFFVAVPLRISSMEEERVSEVARGWALSALAYVAVIAPTFGVVSSVV